MNWTAVVIYLASLVTMQTPAACRTQAAEDFAVSLTIAEGYRQPQLGHELIMGSFIEHGCRPDANFYAAYRVARINKPTFARFAFLAPETFETGPLHETWRTSLIQHYAVRHFDGQALRKSWCPNGQVHVGEQYYC